MPLTKSMLKMPTTTVKPRSLSPKSKMKSQGQQGAGNKSSSNAGKVYLLFLIALWILMIHLRSFYHAHEQINPIPKDHDEEEDNARPAISRRMKIKKAQAQPVPSSTYVPRQPTPKEIQQQQEFYVHHYQQVKKLANKNSVLVWNTRSKDAPFEPWFRHFNNGNVYKANGIKQPDLKASRYIFWGSICEAARAFAKHYKQGGPTAEPLQHVLFFRMNENWGGFSETVPGKTADWIKDLIGYEWKRQRCKNSTIFDYLEHPNTLVAMTTQFQKWDHPKVHSLPLGVKSLEQAQFLLDHSQQHHTEPRTQLVMVNSKPRPMRQAAIDAVIRNFQGTGLRNTFGAGQDASKNYYLEMQRSKFILSPGGLGFDCYRHWEALYMGTIPILETLNRTDGWFRTFDNLPVAWIDSYENLTPQFLEQEYRRIISKPKSYWKYEKLTQQWWVDFIQSKVPPQLRNQPYPDRKQ